MGDGFMKRHLDEKLTIKTCIASVFLGLPLAVPMLATTFLATTADAAVIRGIVVKGNQLIPSQAISDFAGVTFGKNLTPSDINAVLRRLYDSGMFENVDLRVSGATLIITVVENPSVSIVAFEGNRKIKDKVLASVIRSTARKPFNRQTAEADAQRISQVYASKGRVGVVVKPVIIPVSQGRVNLVFEITEAPVAGVTRISFIGNSAVSDGRLRGIIDTNQSNFLSFLLGSDTIDTGKIARDEQKLVDYYTNKGYFDFEVLSAVPELSADKSAYTLTYTVNEGFKYTFGDSSVSSSINGVDASAFDTFLKIRKGRVYRAKDVRDIVDRIEAEAVKRGLPFLRVKPVFTKNENARTVDVNFELVNGNRVYVERIDIGGNTSTLERVIRRQFDFVEGDAVNSRKLREAADKLRALGIFGKTDVTLREGSTPEKAIVDVSVEDVATGSVGFAAGYSTDGGFNGSVSLSERNFLGKGQSFKFELSVAQTRNSFNFSFGDPALFGRDVSASVNAYYRQVDRSESSFQTTNIGFEPSVSFPLGENSRLQVNYRLSLDNIRNVAATASPVILGEQGALLTSALGAKLTYDRRNSTFEPTRGYVLSLSEEVAGLGGQVFYSKTVGRAKGYLSFFDDNLVMSAELEGGALISGTGGTRVTDRFFLGGQSLKGFATGGIGPRDTSTVANDALGGNFYGVARLKGTFPLSLSKSSGIYGGVFVEGGSVWGLDGAPAGIDTSMALRVSSGVSIFWSTPIGPLEFSYAIPLIYGPNDIKQNFSVSVATRF